MSDQLVRAISKDGFVKAAAVSTRALTERARQIHQTSPVATAALGRLLAAGSMMGNELKGDGSSVTLRIKGDGPLGTLLVVADNEGNVRGSVQNPQIDLPIREDGKLDVGGAVGHGGTLTVIKDLNLKEPYVGSVELLGGSPADPAIRARLQARADTEGGAALYAELQRIDPDYAAQVHPNNLPRVIRALELFEATGRRMSDQRREARPAEAPYHALCLCLTCRDRAVLYSRIDRRVDEMVENGVLDEARQVYDHRDAYRTAAQAIGYKEFFPYFEGTANLTECTERLKQATRNYAKRQLTWFRRQNDAVWLYLDEEDVTERACTLVRAFLHNEE